MIVALLARTLPIFTSRSCSLSTGDSSPPRADDDGIDENDKDDKLDILWYRRTRLYRLINLLLTWWLDVHAGFLPAPPKARSLSACRCPPPPSSSTAVPRRPPGADGSDAERRRHRPELTGAPPSGTDADARDRSIVTTGDGDDDDDDEEDDVKLPMCSPCISNSRTMFWWEFRGKYNRGNRRNLSNFTYSQHLESYTWKPREKIRFLKCFLW